MGLDALSGGLPGLYRPTGLSAVQGSNDAGVLGASKSAGIGGADQENQDPGEQMVRVPEPPHGTKCGHCNMQVGLVKQKDLPKAKEDAKKNMLAETEKHEQAHASALGEMAAGSYSVNEDGSGQQPVKALALNPENPQDTIRKANLVINGALAPADPSSQDYAVAGNARSILSQAQAMAANKSGGQGGMNQGNQEPDFQGPRMSIMG